MTAVTGDGQVGEPDQPRLTYRPELDAVRGVAVLLVLLQHFGLLGVGPDNHRAGQAGVTLFFVLSGFLITSLLLVERRETGAISLRRFYVRRLRRLYPALIAMVAIVWLVGLPGDPRPALTYTSNWYGWLGLGDPGAYLHTWTLAIEEQFYLVWPAAFLLLARWPRAMVVVLVAVIVASAAARPVTGILQRNDALLSGALLAIAGRRWPWWIGLAGWAGMLALALVPGQPDDAWLSLVIAASVAVVAAPGRIAWRPLVRVGVVSYALYLWSYPIATVVQPTFDDLPPSIAVLVAMGGIILALVLAVVSERFVERPFRVRRAGPTPSLQRGYAIS